MQLLYRLNALMHVTSLLTHQNNVFGEALQKKDMRAMHPVHKEPHCRQWD